MYSQFAAAARGSDPQSGEEPRPCSSKTARAQQQQQQQQQQQFHGNGGPMDWTNLITSFLQGSPEAYAVVQNLASTFLGNLSTAGQSNQNKAEDVKSVSTNENNYEIQLDISNFSRDEISIRVENNWIYVEGNAEEKQDEEFGFISRQFTRRFPLPQGVQLDKMYSEIKQNNVLLISAPRIPVPVSNSKEDEQEKTIPVQVDN